MKIRFSVVENSLVKCLRAFILLIGFFYSAFSFSAVVMNCSVSGGLYSVYSPAVNCYNSGFTQSSSEFIYFSTYVFCSTQNAVLTACGKYKSGSSYVSSCPAGTSPNATRECVAPPPPNYCSPSQTQHSCPFNYPEPSNAEFKDCSTPCSPPVFRCDPVFQPNTFENITTHTCDPIPACSESQVYDASDNKCKIECWDGSVQVDLAHCPLDNRVLKNCWNGQKLYDCPAEPYCLYNEKLTTAGCKRFTCNIDEIYVVTSSAALPDALQNGHSCEKCPVNTHPSADKLQCLSNFYLKSPCQSPGGSWGVDCVPPVVVPKPDGTTVQTYPDGTTVTTNPDGTTVTTNPDGTTVTTPTSPTNHTPTPTGDIPLPTEGTPTPDQTPGIFNGGGTQSGWAGGYNDGSLLVADSLCYDRTNCARSFCDLNPNHESCSGYSGFSFYTTSEYGSVNVSGTCPTYDFNLSVFHSFGTFKLEYHCVLLEQIRPYMNIINNILASILFITIVLSA